MAIILILRRKNAKLSLQQSDEGVNYFKLKKNCPILDFDCRRRQHQALLQWAYNPMF